MVDIECKHLTQKTDSYSYQLDEDTELWLCPFCNMNLAAGVMKQLALEHFMPKNRGGK